MTMITDTAARPFRAAGTFSAAIAYIATMRASRCTLRDINAMEDHILRDIGLTRADLMRVKVAELGSDRMAMLSRARAGGMA